MKMREKIKRFWTMDVHNHEGFTLVELIIVIAILAILSSVAVVGYSSYIEKANKSADEALLYEINLAFQTACIEAGEDITSLTRTTAKMPIVDGVIDMTSIKPASIASTSTEKGLFEQYFGVSGAKFKVIESLTWDEDLCKFKEGADYGAYSDLIESIRATYGDEIADLAASTFGGTMGMTALMKQLDDVTALAAGLSSNDAMQNILTSNGFFAACAESMGIPLDANLGTALTGELDRLAAEMVAQNPDDYAGMSEADALAAAKAQVQANAVVLYTAQQTAEMSVEEATNLFNAASVSTILSKMTSSDSSVSGEGLAQAALVCGIYTAYVNREGSTATNTAVNVDTVLDALNNDDEFKAYLSTDQGKADIEGYLAALKILDTTTQGENKTEVDNLLLNGFGDQDLIDGLDSLMP